MKNYVNIIVAMVVVLSLTGCFENKVEKPVPVQTKGHIEFGVYVYDGEHIDGLPNGVGKMVWSNGDVYEGQFVSGNYEGVGKLTDKKGTYEGSWLKGERSGQGAQVNVDGSSYTGEWSVDKAHGKGIEVVKSGKRYIGTFNMGTRENTIDIAGACIEGNCNNGEGKLKLPTYTYVGAFKDGQMLDSAAFIYYANGNKYQGGVKDGVPNGAGVMTTSVSVSTGSWFAGNLYEGIEKFKDGRPDHHLMSMFW